MIEIQEDDVVVGESYFLVCDDGVLRYLTVEIDDHRNFLIDYVFRNVHGTEEYRTHSPHKIFKI